MWNFLVRMFTSRCMEPNCTNRGIHHPHGVPCCDEHHHQIECSSWLGYDCDCGLE
jgi:hypothetical protein